MPVVKVEHISYVERLYKNCPVLYRTIHRFARIPHNAIVYRCVSIEQCFNGSFITSCFVSDTLLMFITVFRSCKRKDEIIYC